MHCSNFRHFLLLMVLLSGYHWAQCAPVADSPLALQWKTYGAGEVGNAKWDESLSVRAIRCVGNLGASDVLQLAKLSPQFLWLSGGDVLDVYLLADCLGTVEVLILEDWQTVTSTHPGKPLKLGALTDLSFVGVGGVETTGLSSLQTGGKLRAISFQYSIIEAKDPEDKTNQSTDVSGIERLCIVGDQDPELVTLFTKGLLLDVIPIVVKFKI